MNSTSPNTKADRLLAAIDELKSSPPSEKKTPRFNKISFLFLTLVFFGLSSIAYSQFVVPLFGYTGLTGGFKLEKFAFASLLLIFLAVILPHKQGFITSILGVVIFLVMIPNATFYAFGPGSHEYMLIQAFGFTVLILTTKFVNAPVPRLLSLSPKLLLFALVAIAGLYFAALILNGNLRYFNLDPTKIYSIRSSAADNLPGVFNYISPVVSGVIIPILTVMAAAKKRFGILMIAMFMALMLYAITAHKSPVAYAIACVFFYWFATSSNRLLFFFGIALCGLVALSIVDFYIFLERVQSSGEASNQLFGSILFRRALMVPAQITYFWIDFFATNPQTYWADSFITLGLLDSPYNMPAPQLIGQEYFERDDMSANVGWIPSGYANAGLVGVALYSVLIGIFLTFLRTISTKLGERFTLAASMPILTVILISSDFVTALMTHGLIAFVLILSLAYHNEFAEFFSAKKK